MTVLTSQDPVFTNSTRIMKLRHRVSEQYKLSVASCVNNIIILYGEFSDNAAHKVKLTVNITQEMIKGVFELIGVRKNYYNSFEISRTTQNWVRY